MTSIPLRAVSSARENQEGLAPRTPHSRSGLFDEADLRIPTGEGTDSDGISDSDPLLGNDGGAHDPFDSLSQSSAPNSLTSSTRFSIISLTVVVFAVFLLGLIYRKFEHDLETYGDASDGHWGFGSISYENYTRFPLTAKQYRAECRKIHSGGMRHMGYWVDMMMDVPHPSFASNSGSGICKSTVTYMLGSEVGLMGDLALLAQAAALADSVSS